MAAEVWVKTCKLSLAFLSFFQWNIKDQKTILRKDKEKWLKKSSTSSSANRHVYTVPLNYQNPVKHMARDTQLSLKRKLLFTTHKQPSIQRECDNRWEEVKTREIEQLDGQVDGDEAGGTTEGGISYYAAPPWCPAEWTRHRCQRRSLSATLYTYLSPHHPDNRISPVGN